MVETSGRQNIAELYKSEFNFKFRNNSEVLPTITQSKCMAEYTPIHETIKVAKAAPKPSLANSQKPPNVSSST